MHSWCMPRERQSMNLHARHVPGSWAYSWVYAEEQCFQETRGAEFGVYMQRWTRVYMKPSGRKAQPAAMIFSNAGRERKCAACRR